MAKPKPTHPRDTLALALLEIAGRVDENDAETLREASYHLRTGQPTASAFTQKQESWSKFVTDKVDGQIADREEELREKGWTTDDLQDDETLMELYDDSFFWSRFAEEMATQRDYIKKKFFNE